MKADRKKRVNADRKKHLDMVGEVVHAAIVVAVDGGGRSHIRLYACSTEMGTCVSAPSYIKDASRIKLIKKVVHQKASSLCFAALDLIELLF
ncbi:hypothetical protein PIB30_020612 [Stylosanthes scabra]|uniref:Uncharacterized protein n=1 Tax=Stylosanthes scabra TaxID=79078 RepID=A0ABU6S8E8_9FABA|nr:hypothetical protein [Stylosanthes scabra]